MLIYPLLRLFRLLPSSVCAVRLDETAREVRNAARVIGDAALFQKMTAASDAIKRDIVFSASLYVAGAPSVEASTAPAVPAPASASA